MIALAHPGRHIGIIAAMGSVLIMPEPPQGTEMGLGARDAGLGFVTLNDLLFVGVVVTAGLIWRILRGRPGVLRAPTTRVGVHAALVLALALPIAAYLVHAADDIGPIVPTLILAAHPWWPSPERP